MRNGHNLTEKSGQLNMKTLYLVLHPPPIAMPNLTWTEAMEELLVDLVYSSRLHFVSNPKATKEIWIRVNCWDFYRYRCSRVGSFYQLACLTCP